MVEQFAQGARRARAAGLDGVELHGANGYLITQFLSSGINDRTDEYGGSWEHRARFVLEIVRAIRREVGRDFHLQMKINGVDHNNWLYPWKRKGNTLEETTKICRMLLDDGKGVDAFHVSSGSTFPHPRNPPGDFPVLEALRWYDGMLSQGTRTRLNFWIFQHRIAAQLFRALLEVAPRQDHRGHQRRLCPRGAGGDPGRRSLGQGPLHRRLPTRRQDRRP